MSTVVSSPLSRPPIPASALPNGGSRALTDDVFQTAEEAVLVQGALPGAAEPAAADSQPRDGRRGGAIINTVRSQVAARPCEAALVAAAAGALAAWSLRRHLSRRLGRY
jgi:hypothetical protein